MTSTRAVCRPVSGSHGLSSEPGMLSLYVPAFSFRKSVVESLGLRLTDRQPRLEERTDAEGISALDLSPIVLGRKDAGVLAHFVYLSLIADQAGGLRRIEYELEVLGEELVFLPGLPDPRFIHDAGWRLLLREFDDVLC